MRTRASREFEVDGAELISDVPAKFVDQDSTVPIPHPDLRA